MTFVHTAVSLLCAEGRSQYGWLSVVRGGVMFRFWGAKAALAELIVTSAIVAVTVGNINAQDAFQPYSVELIDNKSTGGLKNCSDATGCGPGPGDASADAEGFAKFKKHFKKAGKKAKVCDVIVYGETADGKSATHFVIAVTEGDNPLTIGQNGSPPAESSPLATIKGNITINSVGTLQNQNNKEPVKDWEAYRPDPARELPDDIVKAQKDAAAAK